MIDQQIIENAVRDKIINVAFHAIVNECFINALPFDEFDLSYGDKRELTEYSGVVLESLIDEKGMRGGFNHLQKALRNENDPRKRLFLNNIYDICTETARKVSKRVAKEADKAISLEEILDNAGLNEDEIKEFKDNVSTLNPEKLSEVIQDKVIATIKTEQEDHAEAEKLNTELKETIAEQIEENSPVADEASDDPEPAKGDPLDIDDDGKTDEEPFEDDDDDDDDDVDKSTLDSDNRDTVDLDDDDDEDDDDDDDDDDGVEININVDTDGKKKKKKDEIAEEGLFTNLLEKMKQNKLTVQEIMQSDDQTFASLAAEVVCRDKEKMAMILINDSQVMDGFSKVYKESRKAKKITDPQLFKCAMYGTRIPVVVYRNKKNNKRHASIIVYDKYGQNVTFVPTVYSDGTMGMTAVISKKIPNRAPDGSIFDMNRNKVGSIDFTEKRIAKQSITYYREKYKSKATKATEALENWYNFKFGPMAVKKPITLFSKLGDFAMEAALQCPDDPYSEIPYDALYMATLESKISFINAPHTLEYTLDHIIDSVTSKRYAMESVVTPDTCDKSMLISTIVYTILETLKTLNIYCPTKQQIQSTVNAPTAYDTDTKRQLEIAKDQMANKISTAEAVARKASTKEKASEAIESIRQCRRLVEKLDNANLLPVETEKWYDRLSASEKIAREKIGQNFIATEAMIKMEETRNREALREMDKLHRYYGTKPDVDLLEIHYNSSATESYVPDVIVRDNRGNIVDRSFLDVSIPKEFGLGMENLLKANYPKSKIADTNKLVRIIDHGRANKTENLGY